MANPEQVARGRDGKQANRQTGKQEAKGLTAAVGRGRKGVRR